MIAPPPAVQFDPTTRQRFGALILERSGLHFSEKRRQDLERGLQRAFSRSACPDLETYYYLLAHSDTGSQEWEQLICQLTVGESYFFRNHAQFDVLRRHVLPEIIARKRASARHIRIWSAGCSTGQEPYSIAMLLRDLLPDLDEWNITILGSDINREALAQARAGLYGPWSFREKGWERMRMRHFIQQHKMWQLSREIRDMVWFTYLNLVEDPYPSLANNTVAFDLILCRNVTIYFTPEITQRVVDQFYEALLEGGWLVVGHSEPSIITYARFKVHNFPGAVLYQKIDTPTQLDFSWLDALEPPQPAPIPSLYQPSRLLSNTADSALGGTPSRRTGEGGGDGGRPCGSTDRAELVNDLLRRAAAILEQGELDQAERRSSLDSPTAGTTPLLPPDPSPVDLCAEAATLLAQGQTEKALERLQRILVNDPHCAQACYLVGKIQADAGHWEDARHWCEQALEHDPLLVEVHFLLGLIHSQEGHTHQALGAMKRVVYLDRDAVLGHYWLANLYRELGEPGRAQKSLQNTAQLLEALPAEALIPWSDGMTAGRLLHIVGQQMNERRN